MKILKFFMTTKFFLLLIFQAADAMEDDIREQALKKVTIELKENFDVAEQIVDLMEANGAFRRTRSTPIMRTGISNIHHEYEELKKQKLKKAIMLDLTQKGLEYKTQQLSTCISEHDKDLADKFMDSFK